MKGFNPVPYVPAGPCTVGGALVPQIMVPNDELPDGKLSVAYSSYVFAGSGTSGTFSATGLPTGLSMSSGGLITGTPSVVGYFTVTITLTNTPSATRVVQLRILP